MGGTEDTGVDELGPVDYMVVEFPPGAQNFNGEMAKDPRPATADEEGWPACPTREQSGCWIC